jgi:hypothetical protein
MMFGHPTAGASILDGVGSEEKKIYSCVQENGESNSNLLVALVKVRHEWNAPKDS